MEVDHIRQDRPVFTVEACIKIYGLGSEYFKSRWNLFDLVIVVLALVSMILDQVNVFNHFGSVTSVLRCFRIVRVLRLVKAAKSLRYNFGNITSIVF